MIHHAIVRWKLRRAFERLNAGEYGPVIAAFADPPEHAFPGDHPLGGTRTSMARTREWYGRLRELFPDLRFRIRRMAVSGAPWATVAMVEWTDHFSVNGREESNQGVHVFRLRWGKVAGLTVYCDTQKLAAVCAAKSRAGLPVAAAAPIAG
jgi:ketosteroid isomerase-like protein